MVEIEKGAPQRMGPNKHRNPYNTDLETLAALALSNKGEWFSIPLPPDKSLSALSTPVWRATAKVVGEYSVKGGRAWVRFYKDSDEPE